MTGVDALRYLLRSWLLVAIGLTIGILAAAAATLSSVPSYQASAMVFVSVSPAKSVNDLNQGAAFAQQTVRSYVGIVSTSYILEPVRSQLRLKDSVPTLAKKVQASAGLDTTVITIAVTDSNGRRAAAVANAVASRLVEAVPRLTPSSEDRPAATVRVVQPAVPDENPLSPQPTRNILVGAFAGVIAGLVLVLFRYRLRTRPTSVREIETAAASDVIGDFAKGALKGLGREDWSLAPTRSAARAADGVRGRLKARFADDDHPIFLVSSSVPGEARTALAASIAGSFASTESPVLLVDAGVERPTLANYLGLNPTEESTEELRRPGPLAGSVQLLMMGRLALLSTDSASHDSALTRLTLRRLIDQALPEYAAVIVLIPPLLELKDGALLASEVSGVILGCAPSAVRRRQLGWAADEVRRAGGRLAGVVITSSPRRFDGLPKRSTQRRRND